MSFRASPAGKIHDLGQSILRRQSRVVPLRPAQQAGMVTTRSLHARELSAAYQRAWLALEARALEPNVNLSPLFALPALKHLDPALPVMLHVAERTDPDGTHRLIGLALLNAERPSRLLSLPHLTAYHCRHAFLGHWLLDRDHAIEAAEALMRDIRAQHRWAGAIDLPSSPIDGPQLPVMRAAAARLGLSLDVVGVKERAVLVPADGGTEALRRQMRKQFSNVERCRRRLQEQGTLDWKLLRGEVPAAAVEDFLALEHTGWKRESGTSLRSNAGDEAFFKEMTQGFAAEGRALFTELRLDDRVIASTCNYVSGDAGFAFKVGWDEAFRKFGLGIFNEAEFVRQAPDLCADLRFIDSGSQPASFIEMLWAGRRQVANVVIPLGPLGALVWRVHQGVRALGRRLRSWRAVPSSQGTADA